VPCYDGRDKENIRTEYINGVDPSPYEYLIRNLNSQIQRLEASLCALITEIEKEEISHKVITQASKSGLIDLVDFWSKHSKQDEVRLSKELHKFSEHEQAVLKRLLNA
jgi:hypothetical protein